MKKYSRRHGQDGDYIKERGEGCETSKKWDFIRDG